MIRVFDVMMNFCHQNIKTRIFTNDIVSPFSLPQGSVGGALNSQLQQYRRR